MGTTATIRMEDHEKETLTRFAEFNGMSFSEWARATLCDAYEDYMDCQIALEASREFAEDPVSYTPGEVAAMLEREDVGA